MYFWLRGTNFPESFFPAILNLKDGCFATLKGLAHFFSHTSFSFLLFTAARIHSHHHPVAAHAVVNFQELWSQFCSVKSLAPEI